MTKLKPYPTWICIVCAKNALTQEELKRLEGSVSTFHYGICGVCGEMRSVTEPRDYNFPSFPGHETS